MNSEQARLRVVYAGTPEFACLPLQALIDAESYDVIAVYSQPDRRRGRGKQLSPSPVKSLAMSHAIPVLQPSNFKSAEDLDVLQELQADIMVVAAYGLLLPQSVLDAPRLGCVNIHASLLPRWRGAAPIERAIQAGDAQSGVTIMQMDAGLDTGDMLLKKYCDLDPNETGDSLRIKLAALGSLAIVQALDEILQGSIKREQQDDQLSNYAAKVSKAEGELRWTLTALELAQTIKAFRSAYTCYTMLGDQRIKIGHAGLRDQLEGQPMGPDDVPSGTIIGHSKEAIFVRCTNGDLAITALQLPGSKMLAVRDVLNSRAELFAVGQVFGS